MRELRKSRGSYMTAAVRRMVPPSYSFSFRFNQKNTFDKSSGEKANKSARLAVPMDTRILTTTIQKLSITAPYDAVVVSDRALH